MTERARSSGSVAASYERFRPGYPDALVEQIQAYATTTIRTALEIGAGTGKATRVLAAHGVAVTATDPDAAMLAELQKHVPPTVTTVHAAFEALPLGARYDLVFAAASMHWTTRAGRWSRVRAFLNEDGVLASFGGPMHLDDAAVEAAVADVRSQFDVDDSVPPPDGTPDDSPMRWPGSELSRSDEFTDVRQLVIERRLVLSADDYLGHLSTVSAYLQLDDAVRGQVVDGIRRVLPPRVTLNADLILHLARAMPST